MSTKHTHPSIKPLALALSALVTLGIATTLGADASVAPTTPVIALPSEVTIKDDISRQAMVQQITQYWFGMREKQLELEASQKYSLVPGMASTVANCNNLGITSNISLEAMLNTASNYALYQEGANGQPINSGSFDPYRSMVTNHLINYCSPNSSTENTFNCSITDPKAQHADVKASSLLSASTYTTTTSNYANAYINNIIAPFPTSTVRGIISAGINNASGGNFQTVAKALSSEAVNSMARFSLFSIMNDRSSPDGTAPSLHEVLQKESSRRFTDPTWMEAITTASPEALMKEMAQMEAYRLWLEYQRYRQMERIEALMATQLSAIVTMQQDMANQMQQAQMPPLPGN